MSQTAFLESSGGDSRLHAKVFRCLGSWFNINALPHEHITNSKLLAAPFEVSCKLKSGNFLGINNKNTDFVVILLICHEQASLEKKKEPSHLHKKKDHVTLTNDMID